MGPGNALFKRGAIKPGACAFPPWVVAQDAIRVEERDVSRGAAAAPGAIRAAALAVVLALVSIQRGAVVRAETRAAELGGIPALGATHVGAPVAIPSMVGFRYEEPAATQERGAIPFSGALRDVIRCEVLAPVWTRSGAAEMDAIRDDSAQVWIQAGLAHLSFPVRSGAWCAFRRVQKVLLRSALVHVLQGERLEQRLEAPQPVWQLQGCADGRHSPLHSSAGRNERSADVAAEPMLAECAAPPSRGVPPVLDHGESHSVHR